MYVYTQNSIVSFPGLSKDLGGNELKKFRCRKLFEITKEGRKQHSFPVVLLKKVVVINDNEFTFTASVKAEA